MFQIKLLLCNIVLWLSFLPEVICYIIAFLFPRRAQKIVLKSILDKMGVKENEFINHPITRYEDYVEQIEVLKNTGVHPTYHEEVIRLCPTSGTSGINKLIPYTKSLRRAFQAGLYPWIFFMYLKFPQLFFKRQYWSVTPIAQPQDDCSTSKVKIGFENDEEYVGILQRLIIKTVWVNTREIAEKSTSVEKFLEKLAMQLSEEKNLGLVSTWSPSLVSLLIKKHGGILPKNIVISSWAHGYSEGESRALMETTGGQIQPKGLLSTEACITIPVGIETFLLSYNSHYFEFRNIENDVLETITSLKIDFEYEVIVTTQSGFLRYATGDIIRVTKFFFGKPSCIFVGRVDTIDLFGEKLDELTVSKKVEKLLIECGIEDTFWFLSPIMKSNNLVAYTLFLASKIIDSFLSEKLDKLLRESYHYDYCRALGQLAKAEVFVIKDSSPETLFIETSSRVSNTRIGDIKMRKLSKKMDWHRVFSGYFL